MFIRRNVFPLPFIRYLNMWVSKLRIEVEILLVYDLVDDASHDVFTGSQILNDLRLVNSQKNLAWVEISEFSDQLDVEVDDFIGAYSRNQ